MADSADLAAQHDFTEEVLTRHQRKTPSPVVARGTCLYCEAEIAALYCDSECRESFEYEQRIQRGTRK